jgi:hypothetical protein
MTLRLLGEMLPTIMDSNEKPHADRERHFDSAVSAAQPDRRPIQSDPPQSGAAADDRLREGIYFWDGDGKRYIDASSGPLTYTIGHGNEPVLAAMAEQTARVSFAYPYQFENEAADAYALAAQLPPPLDRVFFVSGGSEAVEACLKMARQHAVARDQPGIYQRRESRLARHRNAELSRQRRDLLPNHLVDDDAVAERPRTRSKGTLACDADFRHAGRFARALDLRDVGADRLPEHRRISKAGWIDGEE